jgi:NADPH:quinone reductase-like Zn-dependent oxidoreductase
MTDIPNTMTAALLTGHGGLDKIEVRDDVAVPQPDTDEVLIQVSACGMNNTDVNTRTAWYSKTVTEGTTGGEFNEITEEEATWGGAAITFPRIQGADVCGRVVAVGRDGDANHLGNRVLIDPWIRDQNDPDDFDKARYLGSEIDGGYAQYIKIPGRSVFPIESHLPDEALASFACSYQTAENMLTRAHLAEGETIVISGASGGVGSALIQLSKRRGARVIAIAGKSKLEGVSAVGTDAVIDRNEPDLMSAVLDQAPAGQIDVAADIVAGETFNVMMNCLRRRGRYVTAGAIGGPIVEIDIRPLYLRDLELIGATICPPQIFKNLVGYIERDEIRPLVAKTFPLQDIRAAQEAFIKKQHVGNFVITL